MNPASIDYIGVPEKPFTLRAFFRLFPELDLGGKATEMLLKKKTIHIEEAQLRGRFYEIFFTPVKDNEGRVVSGAVILHDITHLKEIDRLKTEFVSIASHQLRTPLTGIKWFTRLLTKDSTENLTARQKDFIRQIHNSTQRMIKLVKDLLDISRIETGRKFNVVKKSIKISSLISNTYNDCLALAKKRKLKLKTKGVKTSRTTVRVDSGKIRQAFNNLVNNAIKYSRIGGKIEIGYQVIRGKEIIFYVEDHGIGIPDLEQNRMFEKFFRASNVKAKETKGSGLGLYISKAIIEAHGGKIWFNSQQNKGTTFYFSLPLK
jgi:signal transduction histidine kinase